MVQRSQRSVYPAPGLLMGLLEGGRFFLWVGNIFA